MPRCWKKSVCGCCALYALLSVGRMALADGPPAKPIPPLQASAADPTTAALEAEATRLVEMLGHDQYAIREQATERLMRLGLPSLKAIELGSKHVDREIRYRCERILILVHQLEFEKRLEAFLNDPGNGESFDFPGWNIYRQLYGDTRELRLLFVEMHRAEPELMSSVSVTKDKGKSIESMISRGNEIQQTLMAYGQEIPLGSVSAMLFVALASNADANPQAAGVVYNFCSQQTFRNAMTAGKNKDTLRKMVGAWVQRGDDWIGYQGMMIALQYEMPEGLVTAERLLKNDNAQPVIRQYAIVTIARLGNESHMPMIEKALQDQRVAGTWQVNNVNITTQVRDIALAALIHMTKQDHKQYGFDRIELTPQYIFQPHSAGFEKDARRVAALKKWDEYKAAQKKPANP